MNSGAQDYLAKYRTRIFNLEGGRGMGEKTGKKRGKNKLIVVDSRRQVM
jgi:hypothetical protein